MVSELVARADTAWRAGPVDRMTEWLMRTLSPADGEIRDELCRLVFGRIEMIWFGAFAVGLTALSYAMLADAFYGLLLLGFYIATLPIRLSALRRAPTRNAPLAIRAMNRVLFSGLFHAAFIGFVGFACAVSHIPALITLGGLVVTGLAFGAAFTSCGAPTFAKCQIVLMIGQLLFGMAMSTDPTMLVVVAQGPLWVVGIFKIVNSSHMMSAALIRAKKRDLSLALTDSLTGLPNRAGVMKELRRVCEERSTRAYVLYLDIDGFKAVNDTMGHAVGDELLRIVAQRFRAELAPEHVIGRIGGDEFVAIMTGAHSQDVRRAAERLLATLREPVKVESSWAQIGASVGGAGVLLDDTPDRVLSEADAMLYAAKRAGRGRMELAGA